MLQWPGQHLNHRVYFTQGCRESCENIFHMIEVVYELDKSSTCNELTMPQIPKQHTLGSAALEKYLKSLGKLC